MNLQTTIQIYAGGPGSGCEGPNCGRKSTGVHPELDRALDDWVTEQDPRGLQKLVEGVKKFKDEYSPAEKSLLEKMIQSREHYAGSGGHTTLYRVTGVPRTGQIGDTGRSGMKSYAETPEAAQHFLKGQEESYGKKLPNAKIVREDVPMSRIVMHHSVSNNFVPNEKEVIVSDDKIGSLRDKLRNSK